ncbi:MAG: uracil-DNA glycosylase [Myxococcota bacterium]
MALQSVSAQLPADWANALNDTIGSSWFADLDRFVEAERTRHAVFPPRNQVFTAFHLTPLAQVRVVLLGQDPYHGTGQAHGLSFSVPPGTKLPPSLVNLLRERQDDLGLEPRSHGCLDGWARQGVLLLNTVLTVREGEAGSHAKRGWEKFTDDVLRTVKSQGTGCVFLLLGAHAQKKAALVDESPHVVLKAVHPSPLSAHRGFFGSRIFSRTNDALQRLGQKPVDWR